MCSFLTDFSGFWFWLGSVLPGRLQIVETETVESCMWRSKQQIGEADGLGFLLPWILLHLHPYPCSSLCALL